jgi:hypothetical protein
MRRSTKGHIARLLEVDGIDDVRRVGAMRCVSSGALLSISDIVFRVQSMS